MYEFTWIVIGAALALAASHWWRQRRRGAATGYHSAAAAPMAGEPPPRGVAPESRRVAMSLANELANLVSGLEGSAHHLIEVASYPQQLPRAAAALFAALQRLRTLHSKLVAFGHGRHMAPGTTDVGELIASLGDDLLEMQLGLELQWDPPPALPQIAAAPDAVKDALLFVCAALLRLERGATRLSFAAERHLAGEAPGVQIEVAIEWLGDAQHPNGESLQDQAFTLDLEAAHHLVTCHGGDLTLSRLPGRSARAVMRWPTTNTIAAPPPPAAPARPDPPATQTPSPGEPAVPEQHAHAYGGALVLESDPALRAVLARELKANGRAVFACADGAAARTLLETTPDRFELLIIDDPVRLAGETPLARAIRTHVPDLKIFVLTPAAGSCPTDWPQVRFLKKPFGMHELRLALASLLANG